MLARWSMPHAARAAAVGGASASQPPPSAHVMMRRRRRRCAAARPRRRGVGRRRRRRRRFRARRGRARVDGRAGRAARSARRGRCAARSAAGHAARSIASASVLPDSAASSTGVRPPALRCAGDAPARSSSSMKPTAPTGAATWSAAVAARVDVRRLPRLAAQHLGQHRAHLRLGARRTRDGGITAASRRASSHPSVREMSPARCCASRGGARAPRCACSASARRCC